MNIIKEIINNFLNRFKKSERPIFNWYWICYSVDNGEIVFNCTEAKRDYWRAKAIVAERNLKLSEKEKQNKAHWFVFGSNEHPDRDKKIYKCPNCNVELSYNDLDRNWDWEGPHCYNCGYSGLGLMIATVGIPQSGRSGL